MSSSPSPRKSTPLGAPASSPTLNAGGTVEPVREILWGSAAGVRKYESPVEVPKEMRELIV